MDDLRPRGGRLVLRTLAVLSALGFLTLVMVQACRTQTPAPKPATPTPHLIAPATKSDTVVRPTPLVQPKAPEDRAYLGATKSLTVIPPPPLVQPDEPPEKRVYLPATKAGILGPLKVSKPPPASPQQGTPSPQR